MLLAEDGHGPLRRAFERVRAWLRGLASPRRRPVQPQQDLTPWRLRLRAWTRWLSEARFWDGREGLDRLEVRGRLGQHETLLVCSPTKRGRYAWLRLEVLPQQPLPPGAELDATRPEIEQLMQQGFRVVLTRGRVVAAREQAPLTSVDPRSLRDAFEHLGRLLDAIEPWPRTHLEPRNDAERCPFCHDGLEPDSPRLACASCGTVHHAECAGEMTGCSVLGCRGGRWQRVRPNERQGRTQANA